MTPSLSPYACLYSDTATARQASFRRLISSSVAVNREELWIAAYVVGIEAAFSTTFSIVARQLRAPRIFRINADEWGVASTSPTHVFLAAVRTVRSRWGDDFWERLECKDVYVPVTRSLVFGLSLAKIAESMDLATFAHYVSLPTAADHTIHKQVLIPAHGCRFIQPTDLRVAREHFEVDVKSGFRSRLGEPSNNPLRNIRDVTATRPSDEVVARAGSKRTARPDDEGELTTDEVPRKKKNTAGLEYAGWPRKDSDPLEASPSDIARTWSSLVFDTYERPQSTPKSSTPTVTDLHSTPTDCIASIELNETLAAVDRLGTAIATGVEHLRSAQDALHSAQDELMAFEQLTTSRTGLDLSAFPISESTISSLERQIRLAEENAAWCATNPDFDDPVFAKMMGYDRDVSAEYIARAHEEVEELQSLKITAEIARAGVEKKQSRVHELQQGLSGLQGRWDALQALLR